ncbi:hypothetical protein N5933_16100 [Klebsiella pneumoniae]|uniref:hypothetical protein n=1 Tax=Klebsiella pneumoniae TaxID=573 RepID=UPI0021C045C0|nr:hypothetical protein [Klebsiella pneumoniae]UXI48815.1 hypothetical protein N5933_16100 [Klebsiella pneumoniae]
MPLRITPSVAEQEGQQTETEATGAPQKHHYTLNQQVGSITNNAQIDTRSISSNGVFIQKDINNMPSETPMSKDLLIEILTKKIKELATSSIEGIL